MTTAIKTSAPAIVICLFASICFAKDWRGIVPLKSTRAEVEQKLGKPTEGSNSSYYYYRFPNELVVISFQVDPCEDCGLGWNVAAGTVTSIAIIPRRYLKKPVVSSKFQVAIASAGLIYYANPDEGLTIETFNGKVTGLFYEPTQEQSHIHCQRRGPCVVESQKTFDQYTILSWRDEKARLDNYSIQIKNAMGRGALVVTGKSSAERAGLMKRAERARKYLQSRGIESSRILIIDGGYREIPLFELNLYLLIEKIDRIYIYAQKDPLKNTRSPE